MFVPLEKELVERMVKKTDQFRVPWCFVFARVGSEFCIMLFNHAHNASDMVATYFTRMVVPLSRSSKEDGVLSHPQWILVTTRLLLYTEPGFEVIASRLEVIACRLEMVGGHCY